jgi:hypothetical protein
MIDAKTCINDAQEKMDMAVMYLEEALAHIRAGKASTRLLDGIRVDSYGSMVPISNVAAVTTPDARIIALIKVIFLGDTEIFTAIMNSTFDSSKTAFEISLGLTGVLALWLGIMKVGENSGLINALARFLSPVLCRLFPDIPKGHPVLGSIFMNMSANMLGLDNAATPLGLKAMKELQELNPKKDTASNSMTIL